MNFAASLASRFSPEKADRVGIGASVLCAIHCAVAPVFLILMPTFGRIWAHPASHLLVALLVVPLAAFSIWKGYRDHQRRWIMVSAAIGILAVIVGAALPAFIEKVPLVAAEALVAPDAAEVAAVGASEDSPEAFGTGEEEFMCDSGCARTMTETDGEGEAVGCVDNCCPSLQVTESGETTLHVPPAAIVTTVGGFFLIMAHAGNLWFHRKSCPVENCAVC